MLDYEKIKAISAEKGVLEIVVEKDYILDWILWGISQSEFLKNALVFKGGTALHKMFFPNWRFSEDLDFTTIRQITKEELGGAINELFEKVRKQSGIELRQKELIASGEKDSEWFFEVKIEYIGPRRQGEPLPTILLHITHDELLEDMPLVKMIIAPYEDLSRDFTLLTYSLEEIISEKIRTVFHQRCWPRDIYDTWRLLCEVGDLIDAQKVTDIYQSKTVYKGFTPGIPSDIDERILRVKAQWKEGLQRQISALPDFDQVYPEMKGLLKKVFEDFSTIRKGGISMLETRYSIKYRNGNLEIEVQGDKTFVEEKFKELLDLKPGAAQKEPVVPSSIQVLRETDKKISLVDFLKSKNPKSHGDKILVFGYYLEKFMGEASFNLSDIEKCYAQARIPKTKNFAPYITQLIRDGYLTDAEEKKDNKKAWGLYDKGLKYVEELRSEQSKQ
ncbi:MAG: nucleotidyl transferase AbiEii/AbiGii toxin family protein [Nitrospirota bacterium]